MCYHKWMEVVLRSASWLPVYETELNTSGTAEQNIDVVIIYEVINAFYLSIKIVKFSANIIESYGGIVLPSTCQILMSTYKTNKSTCHIIMSTCQIIWFSKLCWYLNAKSTYCPLLPSTFLIN